MALALASPALALGQSAEPQGAPAGAPPVQALPGNGGAGAVLPGAVLPGVGANGLGPEPAEFTDYALAAGIGQTDNVNLSSTDPKAQTIAAANADFGVKRSGSGLDATAFGNFTDLYYLQGAYSNQVLGRFDGLATAKLWSDRLKWVVADDYGEEQTDPFAAITPTSLQRVNVFTTGPDLTLRPSYASFITLRARYAEINYEKSPFDGHNLLAAAEMGRQLSSLSRLSVVVQGEALRFDNTTVNTDYNRREAYGHYLIEGARTSMDVQLGATQADETGRWKTSPLARLELTRSISPFSALSLAGGTEYTDAGGSFSNLASGAAGGIVVAPVSQTTSNALRDYGSLGWRFQRQRTTLGLTADWERNSYDLAPTYDTTREALGISIGRSLTPNLSADITGSVSRYDYVNQGFTDQFGTVGGGLTYRLGRRFVVYARYDHSFRRTSGTSVPAGAGYDENRAFVMIGYWPRYEMAAGSVPGFGGAPGP
jgi:Putative beta-barrel porin 2